MGLIEKVSIPSGERGMWKVEKIEIDKEQAEFSKLRAVFDGRGRLEAGTYTRLHHRTRGIVMSDSPDEMRDHLEIVIRATGHVLINGLGLGMVIAAVLRRPAVERVTVIEIDPDVIALVAPHYACDRLEVIQSCAYSWKPPKGAHYGAVWHDIWDTLCGDNLAQMTRLKRKYSRRCDWQGCWGEDFIRRRGHR